MRIVERYISVFLLILIFEACGNDQSVIKEYYSDGKLKKKIVFEGSRRNREEISYYANGVMSRRCHFMNDSLNGEALEFDTSGQLRGKGYFLNGTAIGPIFHYQNGALSLYNERDFKGEIYYVKKYDSPTQNLIKEEGVCLSPNTMIRNAVGTENKQEVIFLYAEPSGYSNQVTVLINNSLYSFDTIASHVGRISLPNSGRNENEVEIYSVLRSGDSNIVCRDSLKIIVQ
ncbi:toxin-antitoxin system YwqK family antitoxin [Flavisolibacter nicotianae]|uniref:toxin-antitoxin system YwqK family antitoxin n=1 Tax=Flavisolibacter nicotianae TaxID=2364882 RepID=UPI000EAD8B08|nr:hypothetical protein [Flavisolibacter nicotianae]